MAAALKELHRQNPLVKMVVSYADLDQNHKGIIYQATNWLYEGTTMKNSRCAFIIFGEKTHPRTITARGWKNSLQWLKENVDADVEAVIGKGKHKYIYCFDKKLFKKYRKLTKPYPK